MTDLAEHIQTEVKPEVQLTRVTDEFVVNRGTAAANLFNNKDLLASVHRAMTPPISPVLPTR